MEWVGYALYLYYISFTKGGGGVVLPTEKNTSKSDSNYYNND